MKFTVTEAPLVMPKACETCRSTRGPFVDTAVETRLGRVYWCVKCVRAAVHALGWPLPERVAELEESVESLVADTERLLAERDAALANRVVPLADVAAAIKRSQQKQPAQAAAE